MGGRKPHLLVGIENNLGARTLIEYASSVKFYLADQRDGRPWITHLPFPVQVVERVATYDDVSHDRFVTRYAYHHGYFDGVEREFRGFGMVEQWDTEDLQALAGDDQLPPAANVELSSYVPPVLTRSWFHTGIYLGRERISSVFAGLINDRDVGEYYREPGLDDAQARALLLDDTVLPPSLSVEEEREACRALKGAVLRQEVYALDGSEREAHPYSVSEQNFALKLLQAKGDGRHAVFLAHPHEAIAYQYERNPTDPRTTHELVLEVDGFGNVLKSTTVVYGRRRPNQALELRDRETQSALHIVYSETDVTNAIDTVNAYRTPLPSELRTYELTGLALPAGRPRFSFDELLAAGRDAETLAYDQEPTAGRVQKRLIEHVRTLYRGNDLGGALPSGELESMALPFESYRLAFTPGLLTQLFGSRVSDAMLAAGGYVHTGGDNDWWIPSGRVRFAAEGIPEPANAQAHFFLPRLYRDPFGQSVAVTYDDYDLLLHEVEDAVGNKVNVGERDISGGILSQGNDYRVLQPRLVTDANGNRNAASFDAFGLVVGTAVMGKRDESPRQGDVLDGFVPDLPNATIAAYLANPLADPNGILARASTRIVYDVSAYFASKQEPAPRPNVICTILRETHDADLAPGELSRVQQSLSYFNGLGREIQHKALAEPGPVPLRDQATGRIVLVGGEPQMTTGSAHPRWVASGWTVFNNKGAPVRQHAPFFSDLHGFEADTRIGASSILFHDPAGRLAGILHADHSWEKATFDPWRQETWDANDTVLISDPRADIDLGSFFRRLPEGEFLPTWQGLRLSGVAVPQELAALEKAAVHGGTPTVSHADSLGRTFLTVAHNRARRSNAAPGDPPIEEFHTTRIVLDIEGNTREVIDASGRAIMRYGYDMLSQRVHQASMDAGQRWALFDVAGKLIQAWDERGHQFRSEYDALRRHARSFVRGAVAQDPDAEILFARTEYGEGEADDVALNLRGNPVRQYDGAGVVTSEAYDFKGNVLRGSRRLAQRYDTSLNWLTDPQLEVEVFRSSTTYDALNRPTTVTAPDGSVTVPVYSAGGQLEQLDVRLRGATQFTRFVAGMDYSANGQKIRTSYGNGVATESVFDRLTKRLRSLRSVRSTDQALLQNLNYVYDAVGNLTHMDDDAQQTIYFANQIVSGSNDYTYDAVYRLISSEGREHIGQASRPQTTWNDALRLNLPHPGDGQAMRRYVEQYEYDPAGNILRVGHLASNGNWTRDYRYNETSAVEPGRVSNRLSGTGISGTGTGTEAYAHDIHGNITSMPHLPLMRWDFKDRLATASRQSDTTGEPETTHFVYDWMGRRMRKVTSRQNGTRKCERLYLGGFEIYREYDASGTTVTLERESLHVLDGSERIALVETLTRGGTGPIRPGVRYQYSNHLGSASLELDASGQIISYEEFYPFGGTSYQAGRNAAETSLKRYRFTAKERDEETGFADHGARYYAPWLGRWVSADPVGLEGGWNLYGYAMASPAMLVDDAGTDSRIPGRCFDAFEGNNRVYNPSRCGPITRWKKARNPRPTSDAEGGEKRRTRRKSGADGSEDGEPGGVAGGTAGGVAGGRIGATGGAGGKKGGVGNTPGTGSGGSGDQGDSEDGGDPGNPGSGGGSGSSDKPADKPGGTEKEQGGEGKAGGGNKGGDSKGKQEGSEDGEPGEAGKNPGESTALGTLAAVAALIDDPESLHEAQQSGNKGTGAQMGNKKGLIGGALGQLLSIAAVISGALVSKIKNFFKKIGGGIKDAFNKLRRKKLPPGGTKQLSEYSQKMLELMGSGVENAREFVRKAPTMEIPKDLTIDDLLKYRAMSVDASARARAQAKVTGRYAGEVSDLRTEGIDILLKRMGHRF
jgi:RHS repeat-associated protein